MTIHPQTATGSNCRGTLSATLLAAAVLALFTTGPLFAQAKPASSAEVERQGVGDSPADPGPLATDLSPALTHTAVRKAMKKVGDWSVPHSEANYNRQWTFAALYDGLLAASKTTGDPMYKNAVIKLADKYDWKMEESRFPHADDMAIGKAYLDLYAENKVPAHLEGSKAVLDRLVVRPDDPKKLLWWWCDALYMAPPVLAHMSAITHDHKYLDYMDKEWWETSDSLYDPAERLYFRDASYFGKTEKNGKKIFWARGNGWVMGGFAKVLTEMPANDPMRPKYIKQYKEMADRIAGLQRPDGLWPSGLLDPDSYELPEVSGSAFFIYSFAWGINHGILDRAKYEPVVKKGWAGLLTHVYADGRLGSIQPIGAAPGAFTPSSSYVYGVGSFLLAGSEVDRLKK